MAANPFAKIDMSLDDIIKLNKKEKKKTAAAQKANSTAPKKLTAAQRKRAETLKLKARNARINKLKVQKGQRVQSKNTTSGRLAPKYKINTVKKMNTSKKNNVGMTKSGRVNAAKQQQFSHQNKNQKQNRITNRRASLQRGRRSNFSQKSEERPSIQDRLGVRINNVKSNQRQKRQQVMNRNRRGLTTVRGGNQGRRGRNISGNRIQKRSLGEAQKKKMPQSKNRQYNRQPRHIARQQTQGRALNNNRRPNKRNADTNTFTTKNKSSFNSRRGRGGGRGRGGARNERKVTLY